MINKFINNNINMVAKTWKDEKSEPHEYKINLTRSRT